MYTTKKDFSVIIERPAEACKQTILHDLTDVRFRSVVSRLPLVGSAMFVNEREFRVNVWYMGGTITGTLKPLTEGKTEVYGQLQVAKCYVTFRATMFLIIALGVYVILFQASWGCLPVFVVIWIPFSIISNKLCDIRDTMNQRMIDAFIETLESDSRE